MWSVYCLVSANGAGPHTYIGATVDVERRLRQHNGLLAGGASATKAGGSDWIRAAHIEGFPAEKDALQFEWAWKYWTRSGAKGRGLEKRISALCLLLSQEKATSKATPFAELEKPLTLFLETAAAEKIWLTASSSLDAERVAQFLNVEFLAVA